MSLFFFLHFSILLSVSVLFWYECGFANLMIEMWAKKFADLFLPLCRLAIEAQAGEIMKIYSEPVDVTN